MAEYLAPGVYVEEVSFRSKSIEGVSTTTTGFVGPARYGPVTLEPDVLTSLLDFERVHGDRLQLLWGSDQYHNYLWHAVRAFFDEGGKRLYVARIFRPLKGEDGDELTAVYEPPASSLQDDRAERSPARLYEQDGHARLWLTKESAAISSLARSLQELFNALDKTQTQETIANQRAGKAAQMIKPSAEATAATRRSAEEAQKYFSGLSAAFAAVESAKTSAADALPVGTLPATLLNASSASLVAAGKAVDEAALRAGGAAAPATSSDVFGAATAAVATLGGVTTHASTAATKATSAKNAANASSISAPAKAAFVAAETEVLAAQTIVGQAVGLANTAQTNAGEAKTAYESAATDAPTKAQTTETSVLNLAAKMDDLLTQASAALDKVIEAQTLSNAEVGLPDAVRSAAAQSRAAIEELLASARAAATDVQNFRGQASSALARAKAAQNILAKLDTASTNTAKTADMPKGFAKAAAKTNDAVTAAAAASQPVKDALDAAKVAVDEAKAAADAAKAAVNDVKPAVILAKTAVDQQAADADAQVQTAKNKTAAASALLAALAEKAAIAISKIDAASALAAIGPEAAPVLTAINDAKTAANEAKDLVEPAATAFASAAAEVEKLPAALTGAAVQAALNASDAAISALQDLETKLGDAAKIIQDEETKLADQLALFAGALTDGSAPQDAVLLRARFPGVYGNLTVRISLRLGDNLLRGIPGKAQAQGLQPGDFAWIGGQPTSADTLESGSLFLATRDEDTREWRFGPDADKANLAWWLNRGADNTHEQLDPGKHFLRVATLAVTVIPQDGAPEAWDSLALQATHTRNGAPDSLTVKFSPEPASAADARLLPIVILPDDSLHQAGDLFKTLFGRLDTTLTLGRGQNHLDVDLALTGGNDGQRPGSDEYGGAEKDYGKTGLKALEDIDDISIVAAPGSTYGLNNGYKANATAVFGLLIGHAERMRYRIAVLDSGNNQTIGEVRETGAKLDSKYAALYYPWVKVLDPVTRQEICLPPSGFVSGIYARNDINRGVYKAPANEVVNLALGFETTLNKSQQDVLNPLGINCFRYFPGRGYRLWGARTISSDPEWKYVNLRRYFAYVEHSIDKGTQWAVFEPNGERLWDNVRRTIYDFLLNEWQNGALLGEKPEKAFFVRCDRSTMTQNDLDNGRLVCLIGIAPLRPAEYVIFRIGQWTSDRKV